MMQSCWYKNGRIFTRPDSTIATCNTRHTHLTMSRNKAARADYIALKCENVELKNRILQLTVEKLDILTKLNEQQRDSDTRLAVVKSDADKQLALAKDAADSRIRDLTLGIKRELACAKIEWEQEYWEAILRGIDAIAKKHEVAMERRMRKRKHEEGGES